MSGSSKKIELPRLYHMGMIANFGTLCLSVAGICLFFVASFEGIQNSSDMAVMSESVKNTLILAVYLVASSFSGEYIENVIAMAKNPQQFYSSIRLNTKERERYYESKSALVESLMFTLFACYLLSLLAEEIIIQASIAIVLVVVINIICFGIIHYYKKFYR